MKIIIALPVLSIIGSAPIISNISYLKNNYKVSLTTKQKEIINFKKLFQEYEDHSKIVPRKDNSNLLIKNSIGHGHDWGTIANNSNYRTNEPTAFKNPKDRLYYNDLMKLKMDPELMTLNQEMLKKQNNWFTKLEAMFELGILIGSLGIDLAGFPAEGLSALEFFNLSNELAGLDGAINKGIKTFEKNGIKYNLKKVETYAKSLQDILKKNKNTQFSFVTKSAISNGKADYVVENTLIKSTTKDGSIPYYNQTFTEHNIYWTPPNNPNNPYPNPDANKPYLSDDYAQAGTTMTENHIKDILDNDSVSTKNYLFNSTDNYNQADGFLFFSPSTQASYDSTPRDGYNQKMTHTYLQPSILWNPAKQNDKTSFFNKIVEHRSNVPATVTPSIISKLLHKANDSTANSTYYSYGDDNDVPSSASMGPLNITFQGADDANGKKGNFITNSYPDWSDSKKYHPVKGLYSRITRFYNGSFNDRNKKWPPNMKNHSLKPGLSNKENGGLPIWNTAIDSNHYVWCSDYLGSHTHDIIIPFRVSNMDSPLLKYAPIKQNIIVPIKPNIM